MARLICLLMGYAFGLIQTGFIYGKIHHIDIRNYGSGNSGATNTLRVLGKKAGFIVLLGDAMKTVAACLVTRILYANQPDVLYLYLLYTGLGVVLGHNYPFYMKFKGGKGIAATGGLLIALSLPLTAVCLAVFIVMVAWKRYVSLASIFVMVFFSAGMILLVQNGQIYLNPADIPEFDVIAVLISVMGIWRHKTNISRLLSGTENKIGSKKTTA